jgi:transposase-like protein
MRLRLLVPQVKPEPAERPKACRWCGDPLLQRHQAVSKRIIDTQVRETQAVRYRCTACERTFRHYPEGVSRYRQSQRVMGLAVLFWTLGLSEWATSHVLHALDAGIHRSSVHRDRLRAGALLQQRAVTMGQVRVLGADETGIGVRGRAQLVGFVVDQESGKTIGVDVLVKQDSAAFRRWLERYTEALGVEALVTDDLNTYKPVSLQLGLDQQICLAHVRKWVGNRLRSIRGWEEEKALVRELVRLLPMDGGSQLLRLERRVRRSPPLRRLVVDLVQRWPALVYHHGRPWVPATNNRTEQAIGKSKVRFKTVRGFKSMAGMLAGVALTQWLYSGTAVHDVAELVA